MKAEVTISNIYWNKGLSNFFFRDQAYETLEELVTRPTMSGPDTLDALDEATDDMDIDDVEETFYSESVEYCAEEFGIELEEGRTKTMINDVFYSHDLKCCIRQISKRTARKLWDDGREIYFHSSNMRFDNMWQHPMPASKDGYSFNGYTFDQVCNDYETYNCDNERGRYIHFFVKAE